MGIFIFGLILFFATHSVSILNDPWRNRMATRLGLPVWLGIYSLLSLAGLVLLIWGYGLARQEPLLLYVPPTWARHLALLLLVPVFPLLIATYLPGRIRTRTQHPMLLATLLWAAAHLLANGNLADVLLFGTFFIWALADRLSMQRRNQRPLLGVPPSKLNDAIALIGGLALYAGFLFGLHQWLIGVPVLALS